MKILKRLLLIFIAVICFNMKSYAEMINVAFTIDNNYPVYTLLTINSILQNNKSNSDYTFWIVEDNITPKNKEFMTKYVEERNQKIKFINVSTDKIDHGEHLYKNTVFSKHVTRIGNARILLPDIMPKNVDKVLYLDSDILFLSDLKDLYKTDIRNYAAAMAKDQSDVFNQVLKDRPPYYNSGVILMNLNYWRRYGLSKKMVKYIQTNDLQFPDQDAINKILAGRVKQLTQRWNNQTSGLAWPLVDVRRGGALHYIGGTKPWHVEPHFTPEVAIYYSYWKSSKLTKYQKSKWQMLVMYYKHAALKFCNYIFS